MGGWSREGRGWGGGARARQLKASNHIFHIFHVFSHSFPRFPYIFFLIINLLLFHSPLRLTRLPARPASTARSDRSERRAGSEFMGWGEDTGRLGGGIARGGDGVISPPRTGHASIEEGRCRGTRVSLNTLPRHSRHAAKQGRCKGVRHEPIRANLCATVQTCPEHTCL